MRVLFIARYRDATMHRKVALLATQPDFTIRYLYPRHWQDELITVNQAGVSTSWEAIDPISVSMIGLPSDPHRTLYRSLAFGLSNFKPDVIHAEEEPDSLSAFQIALARRVFAPQAKLLLHTWQNINRPKQWYVKAIMSLSLHRCDLVMCANCEAVTVLRQQGYQNKTVVLPAVGVDTDTFKPYPVDTRNNHSFVIGFIGRLAPEKGIDTLLEALALIKGERTYQLYLIGNGPQCDQLQAQVKCLGLTGLVEFVGALPPLEVAQKLSSLHTLVLPSRTTAVWKEQLGRALLEAMAVKVPVVGSNSGAIPEVIGDAGLIFPEGDAIALAACLRRLAETPTLAQQLAEKGFQRVQQEYSQKQLAKRTAELYYELVG